MGLVYDFYIKSIDSPKMSVERYLSMNGVHYEKKLREDVSEIDTYNELGFIISCIHERSRYFDLLFEGKSMIFEWNDVERISFDLNVFFDNKKAKYHIIDILVNVLKEFSGDAQLLFNGDVLILKRDGKHVFIDKSSDFWKDDVLKNKLIAAALIK